MVGLVKYSKHKLNANEKTLTIGQVEAVFAATPAMVPAAPALAMALVPVI